MKRYSIIFSFSLIVILFSCEKMAESYWDKNRNVNLNGAWCKTYSTRDFHNSITIFTDTIQFGLKNSGGQKTYKFTELENSFSFQYYTEGNLVFIRPEGVEEVNPRTYYIQNDSLFISGSIPYVKCISN